MGKLAKLVKYALMGRQKVEIAELRFWLFRLGKLSDVLLGQVQLIEVFVNETVSEVFVVGAFPRWI